MKTRPAIFALLFGTTGLVGSLQGEPSWNAGPEILAAAARLDAALIQTLEVQAKLQRKNPSVPPVQTPPAADDTTFLRRCSIDIAGRLPTAKEIGSFLADPATDKRTRLITRLFQESASSTRRFQRMADAFRLQDSLFGVSQEPYLEWLRAAFREDRPLSKILTELLTAKGNLNTQPATGFLLRDYGCAEVTASESARAFLGQNIHCAGCHDHPFGDSTQRQYYELAGTFSATRSGFPRPASSVPSQTLLPEGRPLKKKGRPDLENTTPVSWRTFETLPVAKASQAFAKLYLAPDLLGTNLPQRYLYRDGKPGERVTPRLPPLATRSLLKPAPSLKDPRLLTGSQARNELAEWFTDGSHQRLSKVTALRVWSWMFGAPAIPNSRARQLQEGPQSHATPQQVLQLQSCENPPSTWFTLDDHLRSLDEDDTGFVTVLAREFEHCGHRLGRFQMILAHTQAYQRETVRPPGVDGFGLAGFFPAPLVRRLPPEVVWDAMISFLPEKHRKADRLASKDLPQVLPADHELRILGRGARQWADEDMPAISHRLARLMIDGELIQQISNAGSDLISQAKAKTSPASQVDHLFLKVLSRRPLESERQAALAADWDAPDTALPDIAWALLNTREFLFQH